MNEEFLSVQVVRLGIIGNTGQIVNTLNLPDSNDILTVTIDWEPDQQINENMVINIRIDVFPENKNSKYKEFSAVSNAILIKDLGNRVDYRTVVDNGFPNIDISIMSGVTPDVIVITIKSLK